MDKITRKELHSYNEIIKMEKSMLNRILSSNEDIYKVYYTDNMMIMQFKSGKNISKGYLDKLSDIIEYTDYMISIATVEEEFFKLKYKEEVLQLNIQL